MEFPPLEKVSKPIRKCLVASSPSNIPATAAPVDASSLAGQYYRVQSPALGKTTDVFSLPVSFIAPTPRTSAMTAGQQGGVFLVGLRYVLRYPAATLCGVFSNTALIYTVKLENQEQTCTWILRVELKSLCQTLCRLSTQPQALFCCLFVYEMEWSIQAQWAMSAIPALAG